MYRRMALIEPCSPVHLTIESVRRSTVDWSGSNYPYG